MPITYRTPMSRLHTLDKKAPTPTPPSVAEQLGKDTGTLARAVVDDARIFNKAFEEGKTQAEKAAAWLNGHPVTTGYQESQNQSV
jgi:hypothetical protein